MAGKEEVHLVVMVDMLHLEGSLQLVVRLGYPEKGTLDCSQEMVVHNSFLEPEEVG